MEQEKQSKIEIEQMIAVEDNKEQRALLMVLNNINQSLIANTKLTKEYGDALETHLNDYKNHKIEFANKIKEDDEAKNKLKGATKVIVTVASVIQVVVASFFLNLQEDNKTIHEQLVADKVIHQQLTDQIEALKKH